MQQYRVADRVVGSVLVSKSAFIIRRNGSHFFKMFNGFGLNEGVLMDLNRQDIREVWVYFEHDGFLELWKALVSDWIGKGHSYTWTGNYGKHLHKQILSEKQLVLSKEFFEVR